MQLGHEQRQVRGQQRHQINQAVKTQGVAQRIARASQAGDVFEGKKQGEHPLQQQETVAMNDMQRLHAVGHHHSNAEQNDDDQAFVKQPPGLGIGLENNGVPAQAPAFQRLFNLEVRGMGIGKDHACHQPFCVQRCDVFNSRDWQDNPDGP